MSPAIATAAATLTEADLVRRDHWRISFLLILLALLLRLAFLPFTTLDTGDTAARIWIGWLWSEDPYLMTEGIWGPLHFYMIGTLMRVWPDPVWAPIALHVFFGSLLPALVYRLTFDLFGDRRSAIAAGVVFAVYPGAIAVSLGAQAEAPFMFCLGLGLIWLVRAWRSDGRISHALFAGLSITLASMLRYEAWLILPFLAFLFVRRPRTGLVFVGAAMIHPLFWMIGNAIAFGNPFYSLLATSTWLQDVMAHEPDLRLMSGLGRVSRLIAKTATEMTIPVALLIAAGVARCLKQKRIESVWLLPSLGLFLIFAVSAFRDTMTIKAGYTTTFGLLLIPFVACALDWMGIQRWSRTRCLAHAVVLLAVIGMFMSESALSLLPGGRRLIASPVPSIPDEESVRKLQSLIELASLRRADDGFISDFFGLLTTPYVAWQTRLHPSQICRTPAAANVQLTAGQLQNILLANRTGVLISRPESRLTAHLKLDSERTGSLAGIPIHLEPIGTVDWASEEPERQFGTLTVSRYSVVGMDDVRAKPTPECSRSCPISLCR